MSDEPAIAALTALLVQHNTQHADDMKEIRDRLTSGDTRMAGLQHSIAEVKQIAEETRVQATRTNGRVTTLEEWRSLRIKQLDAEEEFQRGRKAQRADDMAKLDMARSFIDDWWPVLLALGLGAGAVWALVSWPL